MVTLVNRAKMSTSTTGTGTITLGSAESGYQSFADAGVSDGDVVRYAIEDGDDWEIGSGTYTATGTTLSRTVDESSNSDAALNLTGSAVVFITAAAEDVFQGELFAENYDGTSTLPSATGANAVAIGTGVGGPANASGFNAIALGVDAQSTGGASVAMAYSTASASYSFAAGGGNSQTYGASGANSAAIGTSSNARGSGSVALGKSAYVDTLGTQAVALGDSYASGSHSLAAAISTNSSSYGATGANSIAIGQQAKGTNTGSLGFGVSTTASGQYALAMGYQSTAAGTQSVAIGRANQTSGNFALSLGYNSTASASNSVAIGDTNTASHANAITIGDSVQSTAINQVSIGGTADTVRISESYTLPTSDGTNGQVLTTDGSGAVTFADAGGGGGADLYAANESSPTAQPSATGGNAIAIGDSSQAAGADGVAIGLQSYARAQSALGLFGDAQNTESISIGKNSAASADGAVQLGRNGYATATDAVSLGKSRASGASSFAAAISNNGSTYGATGSQSMSIGQFTRATSSGAAAFGGAFANASGSQSLAIGRNVLAQQQASVALGQQSLSAVAGKFAYSSTNFSATGDSQHGMCVLRQSTTDATPKVLLTDNPAVAASTTNQIILPNNSAYSFSGTIIARESAAAGSDYASWEIKGALLRDANAASTVLGNGIKNKLYASAGASAWDIALTADTTNGGLKIEVTGAAATNIRWVATVNTSEVTYA